MPDLWKWFSNAENLKVLSGIAAVATTFGVLWKVYTHFSRRPKGVQEYSSSGIKVGRNIILIGKTIIISEERVKEIYEGKEMENQEENFNPTPSSPDRPKGKPNTPKNNPKIRKKPGKR